MPKKKIDFVGYNTKISTKLDDNISQYSNKNFIELIEQHIRIIARYKNMNENDLIQAIRKKDSETINTYIKGLNPDFSEEIIFNLKDLRENKLLLSATTGLMAKALQKGYKDPAQNPIVVQGLIITRDNKIVLGLRNKPHFRKDLPDEKNDYKIMLCPAGYATFNEDADLYSSFYKELKEELGLDYNDILKVDVLGHNRDIDFTEGIRITYMVNTCITFDGIKKRWKKADHHWEYIELIGIVFQEKTLIDLLRATNLSIYSEKAKGIADSSVKPPLEYIIKSNYFKKFKNVN